MIYVYKDRIINVEWTVLKGTSTVKENFDRALVKLFLIGPHEKFLLKANAKDGIVSAEVPQGLPEGVYSVEIIYIKNWLGVDRPPKMPDRFPIDCRGNDRCIMRSRKDNLFAITEYESEATEIGEGEVVIRVKTSTASYGYDGLSAYEIAVLRGDFEGTEGEWLEWTHERIVTDVKDLLDKLKSRDTRFVVKTKSQRDNLKDLWEGDEVYVIDDGIAYILETEDGKRTWKPCDYGTVTSKYILSLIAGMPGFVADRAIADEFGKRIVDEYLTRDAVRNYMNEVFNDLFVNNPPTIMDGMITVDMLSDAVKQLIGFGPIVNFPDDEFLTTKGGRITPKDRNYDPNNYSGMGRKILRKNMVNGVNVLTQKMMSCPNTVYVITYDYSLREQTITVPENCVLQFEGGTITNGVIKATNVINTYFKPEWFGAKGDNFTDDSAAFQMVSNLCNSCNCKTIRLSEATYLIDNITIYSYMSIIGEDKYKSVLKSYSNPLNLPILISDDTQGHNISLRNLTVESSGERTEYTVKILNKIGTIVDNCYFVRNEIIGEPNDYHGIFIGRKEGAEIVYITKFTNNRVNQCCVTIEGTDGYIDHNELWGIGCKSALHLIKSGNHMISANQIVGGSVNGAMYLTEWATSLKIFGNYFDGGSTTVANVPYGLNADTELIYSTITNNNFWLLDGAGIRAKSSIGNVINGNVFENNDRADNGTSDIILENTMSGSISNNSFVRAKVSRVNKSPILNITGYVGSDYEPIIINGNVVRGYRNYSASIYIPKDSTIKTVNNNSKLFEYSSNASPYRLFNPYGELNYNSGETIKSSPLDARVFTYIETDRKVRLDNLTYVDSTTLPESKKFDFNIIYNKDFNLYINNYNSVLNPPVWVTGNMWLENRYLSTGYCRQIIYSSNGNVLYSRISANSIWSEWVNADNTLTSKVKVPLDIFSFVYSDIVYKITNDIDLNGATLTLPSGCTLDFQGGSFSNGTIVGNGTTILPYGYKIQNASLKGSFKYPDGINAVNSDGICLNNVYDVLDAKNLAKETISNYQLVDSDYSILPQFRNIRSVRLARGAFAGFPTSVVHNDVLYCFYYQAASHTSTPGVHENLHYKYSSDNGDTWSDEKELVLPVSDSSGMFRSYRAAYAIPFNSNVLLGVFVTTSDSSDTKGSFTMLFEVSIDSSNNISIVNQIKVPILNNGSLVNSYQDNTITDSMIIGGNISKVGSSYLFSCYTSSKANYIFSFDGDFTNNTHITTFDIIPYNGMVYTEHAFIKFSDTNFYIVFREDARRENTPIFKYNTSTSKFELFAVIDDVAYDGLDAVLVNDNTAVIMGRDWKNYYTPCRFALMNDSGKVYIDNAKYYGDVLGRDCGYCSLQVINNKLVVLFYIKTSAVNYDYNVVETEINVNKLVNLMYY